MSVAEPRYNYIFSGYDTLQNYSDVELNSTTYCFVSSTTNSIYYGISTTSLSPLLLPTPLVRPSGQVNTTTVPLVGVTAVWHENGKFHMGLKDQNTYQTYEATVTIYETDLSTVTQSAYKICYAFTYDSVYGYTYPYEYTGIKPFKQFDHFENRTVFDFSFHASATYVANVFPYVYDYAYVKNTTTILTITNSSSVYSYDAFENGSLKLSTITSTDYWITKTSVACYSQVTKKAYEVFNDTVTKIHIYDYNATTTITQTVSLNGLYTLNACDYCDVNQILAIGGLSGTIVVYEESNGNLNYFQNSSLKTINAIKHNKYKSALYFSYFVVCAENEIYEMVIPQTLYSSSNLPSQLQSYQSGGKNSLPSQFQTYFEGASQLPSQVAIGNVASGTFASQVYIYSTSGVGQLTSQIRVAGVKLGNKMNCQLLMSETPSNYFDISFKNKKFTDYGIYITDWQDGFYKEIDMKDDYTKDGWVINRFNYFGGNSIVMNGFVITTTITDIQKMLSSMIHETGKLYKRMNFYTIAQLKSFVISPSTNGYFYNVSMEFLAEKPYFRFERATEIEATVTIPSILTGLRLNNSLIMINDDTSILMKNTDAFNYFSNGVSYDSNSVHGDYIITAGYQPMGYYQDSSPYYHDINIYQLENYVDYIDKFYNVVGCKFSLPVYINRFYLHFDLLGTMRDFSREFEIYYKDLHSHQWVKYSLPFNIYYENLDNIGDCLIFDNLLINTYAIKIRYIGNTTNILKLNDKKTAIIVPKYFSKFYFGNANNGAGSYEYLFDIAENNFFVNLQPKPFDLQMIRIYPKTTYVWANKTIPMWIKYKIKDLYFAL